MDEESLKAVGQHLSIAWRRDYVRSLTCWYACHHRDLPWRQTSDPYAIWISETMLQQTQVATVIDYYRRFLARLPDVFALAAADEQTVLGLWAGLGYYRRARQLHAAAKRIVFDFGGIFPTEIGSLMELPGIGRYTAGAIVSIAFDLPAPILEANTQRLYARLIGLTQSLQTPSAVSLLWEFARWQLPDGKKGGSRQLNQAAMELGSLVCKPSDPQCLTCPLTKLCPTAQKGLQSLIPAPKPPKVVQALRHLALLVVHNERWLVRQNPEGGWWTGLWDFPRLDITNEQIFRTLETYQQPAHELLRKQIQAIARKQLQLHIAVDEHFWTMKHAVTRYRITLDCFKARCSSLDLEPSSEWRWVAFEELKALPLTASARKLLKRIASS